VIKGINSAGNAMIRARFDGEGWVDDCILQKDFGQLKVSVEVAWPSVPCSLDPIHPIYSLLVEWFTSDISMGVS